MIEILVRSNVQAFVSQQVLDGVKKWLDGTELVHSPQEQLRREFERLLVMNVSKNFSGSTIIFNANSTPGTKLSFTDGGQSLELAEWLGMNFFKGDLIILSGFHPARLRDELSATKDRFPRLFYADKKDIPLERLY